MNKLCKNCRKPLPRLRKIFCNIKCQKEYTIKKNSIKCPTCEKLFIYKGHQVRARKFCNKKCYGISIKGQKSIFKGKKHTKKSREKMRISSIGQIVTEETKRKIRLAMIKYIEQNKLNGCHLYPAWNPKGCEYFKKFDIENNTKGQYATSGKEFYIKELGYWVDYINKDLKLIMEYDEKKHYLADGSLKKKDSLRQEEIKRYFPEYKFIRIREDPSF